MSINEGLVTAVSRRKGTSSGWDLQEQGARGLRESGESCSFEKEPGSSRETQPAFRLPASRQHEGSTPHSHPNLTDRGVKG